MESIILYYFAAPACVGLFLLLVAAYKHVNRVEGQIEPLRAENADLLAKLNKEKKTTDEALECIRRHQNERIEGDKKKIEEVEISHKQWKDFAVFCAKALDRFQPGWIADRIAGKPEYELIITEPNKLTGAALVKAQMRPPLRPRSPVGDATAKVLPPHHAPPSGDLVNFDDDELPKK